MNESSKSVAGANARDFILLAPNVNWNKVITVVFVVLFAAVAGWGALFFLELNRELSVLRTHEQNHQRKLAEAREKLAEQERHLERLRRDPALIEQVVRQKLGYARANEFVFRFEEAPPPPSNR